MKYICDIESIVNKGKLDPDASNTINKLKENDSITIISSNNNVTLPIEVINTLINTLASVFIKECSDAYSLCLSIGMELGSGSEAHLIFKGPTFGSIKNTITSQNPNLIIGWSKNPKAKVSQARKTVKTVSKKPEKQAILEQMSLDLTDKKISKKVEKEIKDDFPMPKPADEKTKTADEKTKTPKKGRPKKEQAETPKVAKEKVSTKVEATKKDSDVDSNNISVIKSIVGNKYTAKDYKTMDKIILDSSDDTELGLLFACRIHLSHLYEEEGFTDKLKEAYHAVRG